MKRKFLSFFLCHFIIIAHCQHFILLLDYDRGIRKYFHFEKICGILIPFKNLFQGKGPAKKPGKKAPVEEKVEATLSVSRPNILLLNTLNVANYVIIICEAKDKTIAYQLELHHKIGSYYSP